MYVCKLCGQIAVKEICSECHERIFPETIAQLEKMRQRIDQLEEALQWYLEDDQESVEMGILEKVEGRPAYKVLVGNPIKI